MGMQGVITTTSQTVLNVSDIGHQETTFLNSSVSPTEEELPGITWSGHNIGVFIGFMILIIATVVGNLLIIIAILTDKALKRTANLLYVSLASADLAVGLFVNPFMLTFTLYNYWPLSVLMCDLWMTVDFLSCTASFYTLCAIAYDRYLAVSNPFQHMKSRKKLRVSISIILCWMLAGLAWIPAVFIHRQSSGKLYVDRDCDYAHATGHYVLVSCIFAYYVPIVLMTSLYALVYISIKKNFSKSPSRPVSNTHPNPVFCESDASTGNTGSSDVGRAGSATNQPLESRNGQSSAYGENMMKQRKQREQRTRLEKQKQAARMLGIIMTVFLICWLPWVIYWPVDSYYPGVCPVWLYELACWAAYINSGINPFLYVFSNPEFRQALKRMFFKVVARFRLVNYKNYDISQST